MLDLKFDLDGRPRANDDLKTLQQQTQYAIFGQLLGLSACVVSGCEVIANGTDFDVAHGLVFIEGGIHRFDGVAAVSLPVELYLGVAVGSAPRPYFTGGTKDCMSERKVASRAVGGAGEAVVVQPEGALRFEKAREAVLRSVGELQWLTKLVATEYDTNGKGKYGTKAYGWQLSGTGNAADIRGRFPVAADSRASDYAVGVTGGSATVTLSATEVPQHTHQMDNAGAHTHGLRYNSDRDSGGSGRQPVENGGGTMQTQSAGNHSHNIQAAGGNSSGGTDAHENRPPYVGLATREWVGLL